MDQTPTDTHTFLSPVPPTGLFFCRRLRSHVHMVPEIDVYAAATTIVRRYGEDARVHAAMRADAALEAGDVDGYRMWKRILRAVKELQGAEPKPGEAVH